MAGSHSCAHAEILPGDGLTSPDSVSASPEIAFGVAPQLEGGDSFEYSGHSKLADVGYGGLSPTRLVKRLPELLLVYR